MVQPCIWFKEEPNQFSVGQTAQSLTCSIIEKLHRGLDECPRILLSCFRARNSDLVRARALSQVTAMSLQTRFFLIAFVLGTPKEVCQTTSLSFSSLKKQTG